MRSFEPLGRIAVLIDFENVNDTDLVKRIYGLCEHRGDVVRKKAVADWSGDTKTVQRALVSMGTELVHQLSSGKGKNSSDIRLVIEAMDILLDPRMHVDTFVFATSDGDFVPIVARLRSHGKVVIVIPGPAPFAKSLEAIADEFIGGLIASRSGPSDAVGAESPPTTSSNAGHPIAEIPRDIRMSILAAFDAVQIRTGRPIVNSNTMIQLVRKKRPRFAPGDYGFANFKSMLQTFPELTGYADRPGPFMVSRTEDR